MIANSSELFVLQSDVTIQIQAVSLLTSLSAAGESRDLIPARPLQLQNDRYVYFMRPRCLLLPWRQRAEIPSAHWFDTLPLSLGDLLVRFSGFAFMNGHADEENEAQAAAGRSTARWEQARRQRAVQRASIPNRPNVPPTRQHTIRTRS